MSGFDIPMTTHYRNNFLPWKPQVTETMKPVERPGKYLRPTQMSTEYTDHFIGEPNELN